MRSWTILVLSCAVLITMFAVTGKALAAEPACSAYQAERVPQSFDGCAELQAQVEDIKAFQGPDGFRLAEYEALLNKFFGKYCHRNPATGWVRDKKLRDVGPYVAELQNGTWSDPAYYGTHMPVVIWYNAPMIDWLRRNRPEEGEGAGETLPDGAIMVKEMYPAPAARCDRYPPEELKSPASIGFAFMVRAAELAQDGWFWGAWWEGFEPDWPAKEGNGLEAMGFGAYCLNCHASAIDHMTFADLKNVQDEPGRPNVYVSQNFFFETSLGRVPPGRHRAAVETSDDPARHDEPLDDYNAAFTGRFPRPKAPTAGTVKNLPSQTYDHVWVPGGEVGVAAEFITSDQCIGCHDAGSTGIQFDMTRPDAEIGKLINDSPYATWRTSPMGLGGRDPIFYAQLASETETFHPERSELIQNVCLGCHGIQGQRQWGIDHFETQDHCGEFLREYANAVPYPPDNPQASLAKYGALARDGIACTACHRMALTQEQIEAVRDDPQNHCVKERQELLNPDSTDFAKTFTGSYFVGPPDELYGPFEDPKPKPMDHALGSTPVELAAIRSSDVCGSCHTVHLPIYGPSKEPLGHTYEQTTYPEWAFSDYRTGLTADGGELPLGAGPKAQSCQFCHMKSSSPETGRFRSKIASIQEISNFPATDNHLPAEDLDLEVREGFARHTLVGLNVFFAEMAQQFPDVLGIRTEDPMLGDKGLTPVLNTERAMLEQASFETASVTLSDLRMDGKSLRVEVRVDSKVGHKLPSGVGFRRAFLELAVLDGSDQVLWASGRTDGAGVIVGGNGEPVDGEFWWTPDCSQRLPGTPHQPHYQTITKQDQVQIYQELVTSPAPVPSPKCGKDATPGGQLTTSFLSICSHVKDNRLLPHGFLGFDDRVEIAKALGASTGVDLARDAGPNHVDDDPDYRHGGGDSLTYEVDLGEVAGDPVYVRATLYYQAIPPFYLQDRFCTSRSADTDRLYYLAGHLDLENTRMEDWKLSLVSTGRVPIERR